MRRLVQTALGIGAGVVGLLLFTSRIAYADNCGSITDCFGTTDAATVAAVGLGIIVGATLIIFAPEILPVLGELLADETGALFLGRSVPVFTNTLPELLEGEFALAEELGVTPVAVGEAGFDEAISEGTIKWAVTSDGELSIIPKFVDGQELAHTVITGGEDVIAAGEADITGANGNYIGIQVSEHSGHYLPGQESLEIAKEIFKSLGIVFP